jgi:hypothetical protein
MRCVYCALRGLLSRVDQVVIPILLTFIVTPIVTPRALVSEVFTVPTVGTTLLCERMAGVFYGSGELHQARKFRGGPVKNMRAQKTSWQ